MPSARPLDDKSVLTGLRIRAYRLPGLAAVVCGIMAACASPSAVSQDVGPGAAGSAVVAVPVQVDSAQEATLAHLDATAAQVHPSVSTPTSTVPEATSAAKERPYSEPLDSPLESLLRRAVLAERIALGAEIAGLSSLYRKDAAYSLLLAALNDRFSGKPELCRQRMTDVRRAIERSRSRLAPQDLTSLLYTSEVTLALCHFDLGDAEGGSGTIVRAANLLPQREEHFLAQASFFRRVGRLELAYKVVEEMLAVVGRPSVSAYLFCLETLRILGQSERGAITLRRALSLYPADARLESYLAVSSLHRFDGGPSVCNPIARLYATNPRPPSHAFNQALCLRKVGQRKDAIRVAEGGLISHPEHLPLLNLLSGLYAEDGRTSDADRVWLRTSPRSSGTLLPESSSNEQSSLTGDGDAAAAASRFIIQSLVPQASGERRQQGSGEVD